MAKTRATERRAEGAAREAWGRGGWLASLPPVGILLVLLVILAARLSLTETLRDAAGGPLARMDRPQPTLPEPPQPGPGTTAAFAGAVCLAAGAAALAGRWSGRRVVHLGLVAALLALAGASTCLAANRYLALIGLLDLAAALLAGWAVAMLATTPRRKALVCCVLLAVLTAWVGKGLYQRFVDIPSTIAFYRENPAEWLARQGITPGSPEQTLFEGRMNSGEVTGFVTFSNVMGAGMIPLTLLPLALLVWTIRTYVRRETDGPGQAAEGANGRTGEAPSGRSGEGDNGAGQALLLARGIILAVLTTLGFVVLVLTGSRGASLIFAASAILICVAIPLADCVGRHRGKLAAAALAILGISAAAVLVFGLTQHRLPGKSLLFRWQYWTGTVPMMRDHPWAGVGLNNFGDYYGRYKLPESPEDVKDPHNIFMRAGSEMGLPAAAALAGLIGVLFFQCLCEDRRRRWQGHPAPVPDLGLSGRNPPPPPPPSGTRRGNTPLAPEDRGRMTLPPAALPFSARGLMLLGGVLSLAWWALRFQLASYNPKFEPGVQEFFLALDALFAVLAFLGFLVGVDALFPASDRTTRIATLTLLLGAEGMLVYDQINMALLTGPVAMLFWVLLGVGQGAEGARQGGRRGVLGWLAGGLGGGILGACGVAVLCLAPALSEGRLAWDTTEEQRAAVAAWVQGAREARGGRPDDARALQLQALQHIDRALALDPNSVELRKYRIRLRLEMALPVGPDMEYILDRLAPSDGRLHAALASRPSDLSPAQRIAYLRRALWLDGKLAADEPKRFKPLERAEIEENIRRLTPPTGTSLP